MDTDMASVLSNMLAKALHASMQQPVMNREIKVLAHYEGGRFVLSVANRFEEPLLFDRDGLPYNEEPGHGTGMIALRTFIRKYKAQCNFCQQDGWVTVTLNCHGED